MYLAKIYGDSLTVHRGKIHDYLGVDLDFSQKGVVRASMIRYLAKLIEEFPEAIVGTASTPASDNLFQVRDESDPKYRALPEEQAMAFHRTVAQLLFMSARVRRDIQVVVAFLTTRVKKPDEDDWGKLKRCLKYLNGTRHMKLTLSVDDMGVIQWWVDASYTTHPDFKGHSGGMMSMGKGAVVSGSTKHKINTGSSTEAEIVGAHDFLGKIMWSRYFIEAQGYTVEQNILHQDNQAALRLEVNGRLSSTKRTRHMHARYFLIRDYIDRGEIDVLHCPTERMWADVLNKPKQGASFRKDRAALMNVPVDYDDNVERARTPTKLLEFEKREPEPERPQASPMKTGTKSRLHRRSVLGEARIKHSGSSPVPRGKVPRGTRGRARGRGAKVAQQ
jgi:hypothetical protein